MRAPAILLLVLAPLTAQAAPVTFQITGAMPDGPVQLAVFNSAETFAVQSGAVQTLTLTQQDGQAAVTIDLPPGRYAAAAFQDKNGNSVLDTTLIGLPTEPYGFSGTPGRFGPPSFDEAAFAVPNDGPIAVPLETF